MDLSLGYQVPEGYRMIIQEARGFPGGKQLGAGPLLTQYVGFAF